MAADPFADLVQQLAQLPPQTQASIALAGVAVAVSRVPRPLEPMTPEQRAIYAEAVAKAVMVTWSAASTAMLAAIDMLESSGRIYEACSRAVSDAAGLPPQPTVALDFSALKALARGTTENLEDLARHG